MGAISAKDVKRLRDTTGVGMMDCKKALTEAGGDFDKAIEILRKKGEKLSAKRADREANEGCILAVVSEDGKKGVIVKLTSETDFVSKNEEFVANTREIAEVALNHFPADLDGLLAAPLGAGTVQDKVTEVVAAFQEKIELQDYHRLEADGVAAYIHMGNKAGVLVGLNQGSSDAVAAGKDVAMQVAAMKPIALNKDQVDQATIDKELEIGREIAIKEGKPEQIVDKIAQGKLQKFFKENTLLSQIFVKDSSKNVQGYLDSVSSGLTVTDFKHVYLG